MDITISKSLTKDLNISELLAATSFREEDLADLMPRHANDIGRVAIKVAYLRAELGMMEQKYKETKSKVYIETSDLVAYSEDRNDALKFFSAGSRGPTAEDRKALVATDKEVIELEKDVIRCKEELDYADAILEAYRTRGNMIQSLNARTK